MVQIPKPDIHELMKLPFCYVCGKEFTKLDQATRDHVPPSACFAGKDRNSSSALLLPAHRSCNHGHHLDDELVGQLVSLAHGRVPKPQDRRLKIIRHGDGITSPRRFGVTGVDVEGEICLWVRGFHAALYREPLLATDFSITTPFPTSRPTPAGQQVTPIRPQHRKFVEIIKVNRAAATVDCLSAWGRKLRYECAWVQSDQRPWVCIFALDLYAWKRLGHVEGLADRGCVGCYVLRSGNRPGTAAEGAKLLAPALNREPLDPFGL